jgi:hypothetical protein
MYGFRQFCDFLLDQLLSPATRSSERFRRIPILSARLINHLPIVRWPRLDLAWNELLAAVAEILPQFG